MPASATLKSALQDIISRQPVSIKAAVATEALDHEDIKAFFSDLMSHGCISGMVTSLIYNCDTHAFYDRHYHEIEALRQDMEDNLGQPLAIKDDLKNFMAWFAFEETAYRLAYELGIDL